MTEDLLRTPAMHLFALVAVLLVLKMMPVGRYTSVLGEMQPHRTIAFAIGSVLMVAMAVTTLVALV
jgi:hypothetical protein